MLGGAGAIYRRARLELKQHVNLVAPPMATKAAWKVSLPGMEARINVPLRRIFAVGAPYLWGMRSGAAMLLPIAGTSATIAWLLAFQMLGNSTWLAALLSAAAFFIVPRIVLVQQQRHAERRFMELFPSGIDMTVRMLRAGLPISEAMRSIQAETPPPLNMVFGSVADQVTLGVPFDKALDIESERVGLPDFRFFAVAVNLQYSTGGNLAATLEILSDLLRKRRAVRLKAKAATAEVRVSAYVLGAIPFVTIGALLYVTPGYIAPLFYDERGKYILAAVSILFVLAFISMRQMMRMVTAA
jgi:tight adherence protein B